MGELLVRHLFSEISETQSVKADIVDFTNFYEISMNGCKGIILCLKSGVFSFFHIILFLFCGKGSVKNNLVEFALEFAVDLIDLIEQNRRNSELFRGLLRFCD